MCIRDRNVTWGEAFGFLPLPDGRVYAAGQFRITGIPDTLHLVRFMPNGTLDPTFNNTLDFRTVEMTSFPNGAIVRELVDIGGGRIAAMGNFEEVEGEPRGCVCLIDTLGNLLDDYFAGAGCGNFTYQGQTASSISTLVPDSQGNYYICGAYHGYDDGTTSDTTQPVSYTHLTLPTSDLV